MPEIIERKIEFGTPWFELVAKRLAGETSPYYSLRMQDYVSVLALTEAKDIILVRQYRPAVERFTLELPSGHVEKNESPAESGRRELAEECGYDDPEMELLGKLLSDTGRLENRLWCFLARSAAPITADFVPERGVERLIIPADRIPGMIARGEFDFSMHLAVILLAVFKHGTELFALKS